MPGTTAYPAALDTFPLIDANTQENAPGVEHDVVHANVHAAILALQAKVGVDGSAVATSLDARVRAGQIVCGFDGGSAPISVGKTYDLFVPYACAIKSALIVADLSGSIVIDVWSDAYGNFPPTSADSITASAPPKLVSAAKSHDTTLVGWSKNLAAGTVLRFSVRSCVDIRRATLFLIVDK